MSSSFTSPVPGSAVWTRNGSQECRATGRAVLSDLRAGLIWEQRAAMSADAESETVQNVSDDAAITGWSTTTLSALASLLTRYGQVNYANAVRADISRGGPVSRQTMQAVLWAAYGLAARTSGGVTTNVHTGTPANYTFADDAQLPVVSSLAPMPTDGIVGGASCLTRSTPSGPGDVTIRETTSINPLLVAVLIVATAAVGVVVMTHVRQQHGENW